MEIGASGGGFVGAILGFFGSSVFSAYKVGKAEERMTTRLDEHEKELRDLQNIFRDQTGGIRFQTKAEHDTVCFKNNEVIRQALAHLTEAVKDNTEATADICKNVQNLEIAVAVLQAENKVR